LAINIGLKYSTLAGWVLRERRAKTLHPPPPPIPAAGSGGCAE